MKRIAITLSLVGVFSALAYYVLTHPDLERVEELREEYESLEEKNDELADKNERLRRRIVALRKDSRLAERQARERSGLARPNELVVKFEDDGDEERTLKVDLTVEPDELRLAGRTVEVDGLGDELEKMHDELPNANLAVTFDKEVGPLRKERVIDIVDKSKLAPAKYAHAK